MGVSSVGHLPPGAYDIAVDTVSTAHEGEVWYDLQQRLVSNISVSRVSKFARRGMRSLGHSTLPERHSSGTGNVLVIALGVVRRA